jgi:hypothetical protein
MSRLRANGEERRLGTTTPPVWDGRGAEHVSAVAQGGGLSEVTDRSDGLDRDRLGHSGVRLDLGLLTEADRRRGRHSRSPVFSQPP